VREHTESTHRRGPDKRRCAGRQRRKSSGNSRHARRRSSSGESELKTCKEIQDDAEIGRGGKGFGAWVGLSFEYRGRARWREGDPEVQRDSRGSALLRL